MIRNTLETDMAESFDLMNIKLITYLLIFGIVPSLSIYKLEIIYNSFSVELFRKIKTTLFSLLLISILLLSFNKFYISFFREHKPLRYYTNPTYWIYAIGEYISKTVKRGKLVVKPIGLDAKLMNQNREPKLVIMVVGEATRADHFSLNGYARETNPLLKKEKIINLPHVSSCGTSTAHSVPCMFSIYNRDNYSYKKGISTENVLDVLHHTKGIDILWRDNNSNSKGVALRVTYQDYKKSETNSMCTEGGECRDEGMLVGLEAYIAAQKGKDILIVLHQMGNHGPAYYKRYPKAFEKFTPVCETNQLEECTKEEINNAYDNAILYTDDFLVKTITLLKKYESTHQTAMIYMSDHGESLGEKGIYLHGLPYFMAPSAQTHIPAIMWLNDSFKDRLNVSTLDTSKRWSQDNLFHSLLGLFNVETNVYDAELDIFQSNTKE